MKSLLTTREKEKLIEEFEISKKKLCHLFQRKRNKSADFYNMGIQMEKGKRKKTEVSFVKINGTFLKKKAKMKIKKADVNVGRK